MRQGQKQERNMSDENENLESAKEDNPTSTLDGDIRALEGDKPRNRMRIIILVALTLLAILGLILFSSKTEQTPQKVTVDDKRGDPGLLFEVEESPKPTVPASQNESLSDTGLSPSGKISNSQNETEAGAESENPSEL
jgi:hypothetical protein